MDPLTHFALGAALAQACCGRSLKRWALLIGGLAAVLPDLDILIFTGDPVLNHALHRSFGHSLLFVPLVALVAALPFLLWQRTQHLWRPILAAALLAALSHSLLDLCTSYGTQLLWPFSFTRFAWDIIAIIDPVFTGFLVLGVLVALRTASPIPARLGLLAGAIYLGLAVEQHQRALDAQQQLAASRHERIDRGRALPTLGNIIAWRSLYQTGDTLHADALRLPLLGPAVVGESAAIAAASSDSFGASPLARRDARIFSQFADGYIAFLPDQPDVLADMRYSLTSGSFQPFWGIQLPADPDQPAAWLNLSAASRANLRRLWYNLCGQDAPYTPLPDAP